MLLTCVSFLLSLSSVSLFSQPTTLFSPFLQFRRIQRPFVESRLVKHQTLKHALSQTLGSIRIPVPLPFVPAVSPVRSLLQQFPNRTDRSVFVSRENIPEKECSEIWELGFVREGMRFDEEAACRNGDEREELVLVKNPFPMGSGFMQPVKLVVGYALTSKKTKSFLQPKLEGLARNKGILFVSIDQNRPLSEQGPFDIVLHKLCGKEWCQILEDYRQTHPEVIVLDPPDAIQHLHNRQSMLQDVADLNLSDFYGTVGVPRQLVIKKDASSIPDAVIKAGLRLPLVAKPLVADGSAKSHEMSLAYDQYSLRKLETPLVVQEFVNHGGVMFKVYIVGEAIKVVRRFSLPNVSKPELSGNAGVFHFPRVSCAAASAEDADLDPGIAELPPRPLLERLARELRRRLGLRLFNLDIIREHGSQDHFYVIDINYFPGYGKMPGYEHIFTDFLLSIVQSSKYKN